MMHNRVPLISLRAAILIGREPLACHRHHLLNQLSSCRLHPILPHGPCYQFLATRSLSCVRFDGTVPATSVNALRYHAIPYRRFHRGSTLNDNESSKVEVTVNAMKEEQKKNQEQDPNKLPPSKPPKRSLGKKIWDELVHYYHGFRLLFIDIRVSSQLVWRVLNGEDLSRREHRQLVRTVSDMFRLVPFSVFIIIPFMELLLPLFLKLFPSLLPSTFQTSKDLDAKVKSQLKVKLEMAKFLQNTLDEMAPKAKGEHHSPAAKEFSQFFEKIRETGQQATNEEILRFSKLFEDEITLDSLNRQQLSALCRLLEMQPVGTINFLRFQLRMKLRSLKADDQMIAKEGVDSLTVAELQQACRARGMRALGLSEDRLRSQLEQWLELSLKEKIPPSLLLLSRLLYLPETVPTPDQLKATIQELPDDIKTEAKYRIGEQEGRIDNKTKIELIKKEQEAIKREREERAQEEKDKELMAQKQDILVDRALDLGEEDIVSRLKKESLSKQDLDSIEDALEKIAHEKDKMLIEKEELEELKEEMKEYNEDIEEFKELTLKGGDKKMEESKAAQRLRKRVDKMVTNMDKLFAGLDSRRQSLQQKIETLAKEGKEVEKERDDVISINELLLAIRRLQKVPDDTKVQRIVDVLDMMDVDHDGHVEIDHVVKVLDLIGRENVKTSPEQVREIIQLLIQEEKLEEERKKSEAAQANSQDALSDSSSKQQSGPKEGDKVKQGSSPPS